jgi:hypothetical protein
MSKRTGLLLGLMLSISGCNTPPPSPGAVAENYVMSVAEGNYAAACGLLDGHAAIALRKAMRSRAGCTTLLARCLPTNAAILRNDQAQLFYSNVNVTIAGTTATVKTSGTAVANRIREVTLAKERGRWLLTSYGRQRCPVIGGARRHRPHRKP